MRRLPVKRFAVLGSAFVLAATSAAAVAAHSSNDHWKKYNHDSRAHFKIVWDMPAGEWSVPESVGDWNSGQNKLEFNQERNGKCGDHNCAVQTQDPPPTWGFGADCTGVLGASGLFTGSDYHAESGISMLNRSCINAANSYKRHVITCHEIEHLVRLFHRDGGSSCFRSPYDEITSNSPDGHDNEAIVSMYSHGT